DAAVGLEPDQEQLGRLIGGERQAELVLVEPGPEVLRRGGLQPGLLRGRLGGNGFRHGLKSPRRIDRLEYAPKGHVSKARGNAPGRGRDPHPPAKPPPRPTGAGRSWGRDVVRIPGALPLAFEMCPFGANDNDFLPLGSSTVRRLGSERGLEPWRS